METKVKKYISINEILVRLLRNPLLKGITKEQVVQYVVDFIGIAGVDFSYDSKEITIPITKYRGELPCDVVRVISVRDHISKYGIRAMTDSFNPLDKRCDVMPYEDVTYKIQGTVIIVSFPEGVIDIVYTSTAVDDDGLPLLVDNPLFLTALEEYIKVQVYTIKFDQGQIPQNVYQNAQSKYAWAIGRYVTNTKMPNEAEMESIKNMMSSSIMRVNEFRTNFHNAGNQELLKIH